MKYFYILFLFFLSCKNQNERVSDKIKGSWAIEKIFFLGEDYQNDLYINTLIFKDEIISLPKTSTSNRQKGLWRLDFSNKKTVLIIDCENETFKGIYTIKFVKNHDRKLLGIELTSDKTFILAYKFLQDFDSNGLNWEFD